MTGAVAGAQRPYEHEEVWFPCSADVLGWDNQFHELMLGDVLRMRAYEAAIRRAVRPGATVLDLGTGTGILARWALEAGAARVYGLEVNPHILALAQQGLAERGLADRFVPIEGLSYDVTLPEQVDLVISEIIGNLGDNEDCARILADARSRFLKAGGRMLPERMTTFLVPVAATRAHAGIGSGHCRGISGRYDLHQLLGRLGIASPFDVYYDVIIPAETYLAQPAPLRRFDFDAYGAVTDYSVHFSFVVTKPGPLTGFKGWFVAELADGVVLDISGDDIEARTTSDSWKHCFLPISEPVALQAGDIVRTTLERVRTVGDGSPFACRYSWRGSVERDGKTAAQFAQGMTAVTA